MDDKTMLELAAKAAGLKVEELRPGRLFLPHPKDKAFLGPEWNPLTDDGDALRLAVKLRIEVRPVYMWKGPWDDGGALQDPYAATRLAIVRAAAEIGRKM